MIVESEMRNPEGHIRVQGGNRRALSIKICLTQFTRKIKIFSGARHNLLSRPLNMRVCLSFKVEEESKRLSIFD